jgi:hypothetical protein
MNQYLPSKQFIIKTTIIVVLIMAIWGIGKVIKIFKKNNTEKTMQNKVLVKDVVQKDSNTNGIPDWEESLWGLDPNKDGESNKQIIESKREELSRSSENYIIEGPTPSKETEDLSKEFFSVIISLQQTGNLDDNAIQAISKAIGEKITATPIKDTYTENMLTIKTTNEKSVSDYYDAFKKLSDKYSDKDIGNELIFISQGLKNNDPKAVSVVGSIAESYRLFGQELIKIPVPESISEYHLNLANNYEKVSRSIIDLMQILSEPILGMKALINYKNYTDDLVLNIEDISDNL